MYPDTKTARSTDRLELSDSACLMDFLVVTNNCEVSSSSIIINGIEDSHTYPLSLLKPIFESKNSN